MPGIEFVTLGHSSRNNHRQVPIAVFRSVDIWVEHWPTVHGLPPSPPEGLDGYMVVELSLGRRGTGGYEFDISGVDIDDAGAMIIHVLERPPDPGNPDTQAVEMHLIAVATPRHSGPIRLDLQVEAIGNHPNRGIADVATRQPPKVPTRAGGVNAVALQAACLAICGDVADDRWFELLGKDDRASGVRGD